VGTEVQGPDYAAQEKPKELAVITECCTGCAGSPACVEYCPVEDCMFWVPDEDATPFGRIAIDPYPLHRAARNASAKDPTAASLTVVRGMPSPWWKPQKWKRKSGYGDLAVVFSSSRSHLFRRDLRTRRPSRTFLAWRFSKLYSPPLHAR